MSHQPRTIRLENSDTYTTRNRAKRFIKRGKAEWTDEHETAIRFVAHFSLDTTRSTCGARLLVVEAHWEKCYRTAEAPVLQPSVDWLNSLRSGGSA